MSATLNTNASESRKHETIEKVTGRAAAEMLRRSFKDGLPPLEVLDNACGPAVVTASIFKHIDQHPGQLDIRRIVASDTDKRILDYVRRRAQSSGWDDLEVMVVDQQSVPFPDNSFTHVFNNFGIFFCADDDAALAETLRILKPGNTAGFTSWAEISWWTSLAVPALEEFVPGAPALPDPSTLFPNRGWNDAHTVAEKLKKANFRNVEVHEYSFTTEVEAEEFGETCGGLVKVTAKRSWPEETYERLEGQIEAAMVKYLQQHYPGGKWNGQMKSIIALGTKDM